jgi:hypothetical protein
MIKYGAQGTAYCLVVNVFLFCKFKQLIFVHGYKVSVNIALNKLIMVTQTDDEWNVSGQASNLDGKY